MDVLGAVGRSNMNQSLGMVLQDIQSRRASEIAQQRTDLMQRQEDRIGESAAITDQFQTEQLKALRRQEAERQKKITELRTPHPITAHFGNFYGGMNGKIAQRAIDFAKETGLIEDVGGVPAITPENMNKVYEWMETPQVATQFSIDTVNMANSKFNELNAALKAEGPDAQKMKKDVLQKYGLKEEDLPQATDEAFVEVRTAMGENKALMEANKQALEEAKAAAAAQGEPSFTDIEGATFQKWLNDQPLSPQEQQIITRKLKGTTGKSPREIKEGAKARLEAKVEAMRETLNREPTEDEKRRIFINDPYGILAPEEPVALPPGVNEEDVEFTMKKHNLTREEVLQRLRQ